MMDSAEQNIKLLDVDTTIGSRRIQIGENLDGDWTATVTFADGSGATNPSCKTRADAWHWALMEFQPDEVKE